MATTRWELRDDSGWDYEFSAQTWAEAVKKVENWVYGGDYREFPPTRTTFVPVYIRKIEEDFGCRHYVALHPDIPCQCSEGHEWTPVPEGCRENPGVWGGVGLSIHTRCFCPHCLLIQEEVVNPTMTDTGMCLQGESSYSYKEMSSDEIAAWVQGAE